MAPSALVPCDGMSTRSGRYRDVADLHLGFELVLQHPVELLHIVLQEGVQRLPPKGFGQLSRTYQV